jgi:predicted adenylyl cyclase CyaB
MPKNLEIKARCASLSSARQIARSIGARFAVTLRQTDTYFKVKQGRLKLREINRKQRELIFYRRENARKNRYSNYSVLQLPADDSSKRLLRSVFKVSVVVKKKRELYLYKNSRIHVDSVERLGGFVEFEVLVVHGNRQAQALMAFLRGKFGIGPSSLIAGSYSDMILEKQ